MPNKKTIIHIAHYSAPYMGNFIASLVSLEKALHEEQCSMVYIFPDTCKHTNWINHFSSEHRVYFVSSAINIGKFFFNPILIDQLAKIIKKESPCIIHSHFDGFDIPVVLANKKSMNQARIIWHHHNPRTLVSNPVKRLYQRLCFFRQYVLYGKKVHIITASKSCLDELKSYHFDLKRATAIDNGICEERINYRDLTSLQTQSPFTFLCFGGRGNHKGIDILLKAVHTLGTQLSYKLLLVQGQDTDEFLANAPQGPCLSLIELTPPPREYKFVI